jgi:hypothetical protein
MFGCRGATFAGNTATNAAAVSAGGNSTLQLDIAALQHNTASANGGALEAVGTTQVRGGVQHLLCYLDHCVHSTMLMYGIAPVYHLKRKRKNDFRRLALKTKKYDFYFQ